MGHNNITDTCTIENRLVLKDKAENSVSLKPVKASTAKPNGKTTTRDKTLGFDPDISFYEIEDGDKT